MTDLRIQQDILDELAFEPSIDAAHIGVSVWELDDPLGNDRAVIEQFRHPVAQRVLHRDHPRKWSKGWPDSIGHLIDALLQPQVRIGLENHPPDMIFGHAVP